MLATLHTHNAAQTIDRIIDIFPSHQQQQIRLQVSMTLTGIISQNLIPQEGGGRVATREILLNTPAVANLIRENKIAQIKTVIQTSAKEGMITMDQDLINMFSQKLISKETAQSHMTHPEMLNWSIESTKQKMTLKNLGHFFYWDGLTNSLACVILRCWV